MARFNTQSITTNVTAPATIASPQSFTEFTGTAPYTVTLPSPTLFPGVNQTFYNSTSGQVTLSVSGATFSGTGGTGGMGYIMTGGYTNGTGNFSHNDVTGGTGSWSVTSTSADVIKIIWSCGGTVHPVATVQITGSLSQAFSSSNLSIVWS